MMKTFLKIIFAFILFFQITISQNISPYSSIGIGTIVPRFSSSFGLYNAPNVSFLKQDFINNLNPAANGKTRYTIFSLNSNVTKTELSDNFSTVQNLDGGAFGDISFAIPINIEKGITITTSIFPYSIVNDELKLNSKLNNYRTEEIFSGSGGLSTFQLGASYSPLKDLFFGFSTEYIFGERNLNNTLNFLDTTFQSNKNLTFYSENTLGSSFGFIYENLNQKLNLAFLNNFSIGAYLMLPRKMSSEKRIFSEREYIHESNFITQYFDTTSSTENYDFPAKITLGSTFELIQKMFSFEYSFQDWSKSLKTSESIKFSPDENYSFAFSTLPVESQSFKDNISFSAGFSYRKTYLNIFNERITEKYFSIGSTIPISYTGKLQIGLSYIMRGTKNNNLVNENIFGAFLNLTIGELWFIQPPID